MDPVLRTKLALEQKLARRLRGTLTALITEWYQVGPYERQALIAKIDFRLSKLLFEHQHRTSLIVRHRGLALDHNLHRQDSRFLVGSVVDRLIENEDIKILKGVFKQRIRKWATNTATRLVQRDVERGRWALVQERTKGLILKAWSSRMDGIERPDHHNAHLKYTTQPIPVNQPFIVGKGKTRSKLMFPGDTTLGAGPEQTFFCRCSVRYYNAAGKLIRTQKARPNARKKLRRSKSPRKSNKRPR